MYILQLSIFSAGRANSWFRTEGIARPAHLSGPDIGKDYGPFLNVLIQPQFLKNAFMGE